MQVGHDMSLRQLVIMEKADKIFCHLNEGEEDRLATKTFRGSRADPNLRRL